MQDFQANGFHLERQAFQASAVESIRDARSERKLNLRLQKFNWCLTPTAYCIKD